MMDAAGGEESWQAKESARGRQAEDIGRGGRRRRKEEEGGGRRRKEEEEEADH